MPISVVKYALHANVLQRDKSFVQSQHSYRQEHVVTMVNIRLYTVILASFS